MKILVLSATKGGCGKTTISACLAVHAASRGYRVAMLDLDPQETLWQWWERRGEVDNPRAYEVDDHVAERIEQIRGLGSHLLVIDTNPALLKLMERAVAKADLVLIPVKASSLDLLQVDPITELCDETETRWATVPSDINPTWKISKSLPTALAKIGDVVDAQVSHRAAYVTAMTTGKTGPESDKRKEAEDAREEIAQLWSEVASRIGMKVVNDE